jgi:hypothetical protein
MRTICVTARRCPFFEKFEKFKSFFRKVSKKIEKFEKFKSFFQKVSKSFEKNRKKNYTAQFVLSNQF